MRRTIPVAFISKLLFSVVDMSVCLAKDSMYIIPRMILMPPWRCLEIADDDLSADKNLSLLLGILQKKPDSQTAIQK
jgi:hypothetical protein